MLRKFKMEGCKDVITPLVATEKFKREDGAKSAYGSTHRSLVDSLLYLTATRLDIMFAASLLSGFMQSKSF